MNLSLGKAKIIIQISEYRSHRQNQTQLPLYDVESKPRQKNVCIAYLTFLFNCEKQSGNSSN